MEFSDFRNIDDLIKKAFNQQVTVPFGHAGPASPSDFPEKAEVHPGKPGDIDKKFVPEVEKRTVPEEKAPRPEDKVRSGM